MRRVQVLNTLPLSAAQLGRLEAVSPLVEIQHRLVESQEAMDELAESAAEVVLGDFAPTDLTRSPSLRWLQYSGSGVDELSATSPWEQGVIVTTASGVNALAIGEYVLASLLEIVQRTGARRQYQRARSWKWDDERTGLFGRQLRGRTVAIVGYGSAGREVARLADAFGMTVLAVKAHPEARAARGFALPGTGDPDGVIPREVAGVGELARMVSRADFVVVTAPLTAATRGALGREILRAISPDAWLVNVGRGELFDGAGLSAALETKRLAGAVLDVTVPEPLPADSPLWTMDNVVVTPHVAGATEDIWDRLTVLFAENLRRYVAGEPLLNRVDPADGY